MDKDKKPEKALEARKNDGERQLSPSSARNRDAILGVFLAQMPHEGRVLEIGSGTGEHAVHIAARLPQLSWFPGDPDAAARRSIAAWIAHTGLANIRPPHALDVALADWTRDAPRPVEAIVSINMIHIAPLAAAAGLIAGAGEILAHGGKLFLYGPFSRSGAHTAPSNAAFDASLKARDPSWGVRDLERDIVPLAEKAGLALDAAIAMPANNFSVIFVRA